MFYYLPFNIFIYQLNGILIDYIETHKDLGVMVDSKLNWGYQYDNLFSNYISKLDEKLMSLKVLLKNLYWSPDMASLKITFFSRIKLVFSYVGICWYM